MCVSLIVGGVCLSVLYLALLKRDDTIGHSEIAQGTGASFKFKPIDKLTPPHERSR